MVVVALFKVLALLLVLGGALLPLVLWIERKQRAVMGAGVAGEAATGFAARGFLRAMADVLARMGAKEFVPRDAHPWVHRFAPFASLVPAVAALAVVPVVGVYHVSGLRLSGVVAEADWGVLAWLAIVSLATFGAVIAGVAAGTATALDAASRVASRRFSYLLTLGFSLVGLFLFYGTLDPQRLAMAQDTTLRLFGLPAALLGVEPAWIEWVRVPAWGIVVQPLAFVLFLVGVTAVHERPPFDLPESADLATASVDLAGVRIGPFFPAEFLHLAATAGLLTTLFLGGWSLPWMSTRAVVDGLGALVGTSFATGLCIFFHFAAFLLKVLAMVWLQLALRWALPRVGHARSLAACWKFVLPLALANVLVTAALVLVFQERV